MAAPSALVLTCAQCGSVAPHRVLRGKIGGTDEIVFEGVVKCPACGFVSSVVTREPKPIEVPLVVSWLDKSEKTSLEFSPEEDVHVGEALDLGDSRISITAIEAGGRRVDGAKAREVATLW
ncbi:MAG TPA: HVO_0476 family zinc finger protein, partial [Thermoplasmata archaeon]|nr:HVO_0476 family zinc finger protein [Thermoplasmata archaeon]